MEKIGEATVEVNIDDKASAMLESVCKRMNRSALLALVSAAICAVCTVAHAFLLHVPPFRP